MTILVIEDSRFLQRVIDRLLRKAGYQAVVVSDGQEGLRQAQEQLPDLVLLDIMLPRLSGTAVLHALKTDPRTAKIPVVVLTALSRQNEAKLKEDGIHAFLEKAGLDLEKEPEVLTRVIESTLKQVKAVPESV